MILNLSEISEKLGVSEEDVLQLIRKKKLPAHKTPKGIIAYEPDLINWQCQQHPFMSKRGNHRQVYKNNLWAKHSIQNKNNKINRRIRIAYAKARKIRRRVC